MSQGGIQVAEEPAEVEVPLLISAAAPGRRSGGPRRSRGRGRRRGTRRGGRRGGNAVVDAEVSGGRGGGVVADRVGNGDGAAAPGRRRGGVT